VQIREETDDNTNPMRRIVLFRSFDYFFYLSHVRAFSDPLIFGEVLADSDYAEHLTSWYLKVEVGVRYIKLPYAEIKNFCLISSTLSDLISSQTDFPACDCCLTSTTSDCASFGSHA
jgi:hypothetical protein